MTAVSPRLTPLPSPQWGHEETELLRGHLARADRYLSGGPDTAPVPPILGLLARNPRIGGPWLAFCGSLLEGSIGDRERELLVLRLAWRTGNSYLWFEHVPLGVAAGLGPHELEVLRTVPDADTWNDRERLLLHAADELVETQVVSDGTWSGLAEHFDEPQLLELLFLIGAYVCLSMVLNSVGLEPRAREG